MSADPVASAFAGRLREAGTALSRDPDHPASGWLEPYLACARGDFQQAERLARAALRSKSAEVRARAGITLGSVLRQTGRHAEARAPDRRALAAAPTASLRAHAIIGLAADAVGLGEVNRCAAHLALASDTAPPRDWRVRVRLSWVRAEHALLAHRPRPAVRHARAALARSSAAGAKRHMAKSHLFLAAALRASGQPGWIAEAKRAASMARALGARPVADAAAALLAAERALPGLAAAARPRAGIRRAQGGRSVSGKRNVAHATRVASGAAKEPARKKSTAAESTAKERATGKRKPKTPAARKPAAKKTVAKKTARKKPAARR